MPLRSNHPVLEYGSEATMNPQLANRVVLRCEAPYWDPRHHAQGQHLIEEDLGSGRTTSMKDAGEVRVKQEGGGWVSPFESWHARPDQRYTTGISHPRMDYQVQLQQPPPTGYYQPSSSPAPIYTQARQFDLQQQHPPRHGAFDMQPMALNVPRLQQPEYQPTGPGPYGYLSSSEGSIPTPGPTPVHAPGPGGWYPDEYAASTPSTTTSGGYGFGSGIADRPMAPRHGKVESFGTNLSGHSPGDPAMGPASYNSGSASAHGAVVVGSGGSYAPSGSAENSPAQAGSTGGKTAGPGSATAGSGGGGAGAGGKAVKKKAAKACLQCQRAHLTCDDSRPCTRCVKKGQGDQCCEGQRKKAKYLMTESELAEHEAKKRERARARKMPAAGNEDSKKATQVSTGEGTTLAAVRNEQQDDVMTGGQQDDVIGQELRDPGFGNESSLDQGFQFDSQAANLEYAVLDSIFADLPGLAESNGVESFMNAWQGAAMGSQSMIGGNVPSQTTLDSDMMDFSVGSGSGVQPVIPSLSNESQDETRMGGPAIGSVATQVPASSVYDLVSEPYDYTISYHQLMRFLAKNFDQKSILRVVKSLAAFRPSLIALQMPLSFEDEVFLEKSFQRTLIELEKLISYSGTPTAVWRRTGEICVVGDEFATLTGWNRTDLLGANGTKGKFIYELLDRSSTVDYFAKFSQHAFENTAQNFYMQVVLQNGSGESGAKEIRCAASFTIRRDVFDLPCAVIGQLLPING